VCRSPNPISTERRCTNLVPQSGFRLDEPTVCQQVSDCVPAHVTSCFKPNVCPTHQEDWQHVLLYLLAAGGVRHDRPQAKVSCYGLLCLRLMFSFEQQSAACHSSYSLLCCICQHSLEPVVSLFHLTCRFCPGIYLAISSSTGKFIVDLPSPYLDFWYNAPPCCYMDDRIKQTPLSSSLFLHQITMGFTFGPKERLLGVILISGAFCLAEIAGKHRYFSLLGPVTYSLISSWNQDQVLGPDCRCFSLCELRPRHGFGDTAGLPWYR
jgi:hypothetical protein